MQVGNTDELLKQIRHFSSKDVFKTNDNVKNLAKINDEFINKDMVMQLVSYNNQLISTVRELAIQVEKTELDLQTIANVLLKNHLVQEIELDAEGINLLNKRNDKIRKVNKPLTLKDII